MYVVIPMWPEGIPSDQVIQEILSFQRETVHMVRTFVPDSVSSHLGCSFEGNTSTASRHALLNGGAHAITQIKTSPSLLALTFRLHGNPIHAPYRTDVQADR